MPRWTTVWPEFVVGIAKKKKTVCFLNCAQVVEFFKTRDFSQKPSANTDFTLSKSLGGGGLPITSKRKNFPHVKMGTIKNAKKCFKNNYFTLNSIRYHL
jgi:hypothetical protein